MSWRDLEGQTIKTVRPVDQNEVVLELENGQLARIRATHPPSSPESEAELELELREAKSRT
jgi:hypothetical protein